MSSVPPIQPVYNWIDSANLDTQFPLLIKETDHFFIQPPDTFPLFVPHERDLFFRTVALQHRPFPSYTENSFCVTEIGKGVFSALTLLGTEFIKGIFDFQPVFIGTIAGLESLYQGTIHFFDQGVRGDTASIANELTLLFSTALLISLGLKSHCRSRIRFNSKRRLDLDFHPSQLAYETGTRIFVRPHHPNKTPHILFMSGKNPSRPPKPLLSRGGTNGAKKALPPESKSAAKPTDSSFPDEPTQIDQTFFLRRITDLHHLTRTVGQRAVELRALVTERTGHYGERSRLIIAKAREELHGFQQTRLIAQDAQKQLERLIQEMNERLGKLEKEYLESLRKIATKAGEKNPMKLRREEIVVSSLKARIRETAEAIQEDYQLWTEEIQRQLFAKLNQIKESRHFTPQLKSLIQDFLRKIGVD